MKVKIKVLAFLFILSIIGFAQENNHLINPLPSGDFSGSTKFGQDDERPVRDNVGFCWNPLEMERLISYLKENNSISSPPRHMVAAISPHDDYLYAARVYYPLYRVFRAREVVIFGVTHSTVRSQIGDPHNIIILESYRKWHGLTHPVSISPLRDFIKARLDTSDYMVSNKAHALEHSIEALIPFLQYFNPDVKITPIMVTQMQFEKMDEISGKLSSIVSEYIKTNHLVPGKDIAFLISSDANHYGPDFNNNPFGVDLDAHTKATYQDKLIAQRDLEGKITPQKVKDFSGEMKNVVWCGKFSIPFGLLTVEKVVRDLNSDSLEGKLIAYSDSYTEGVIPLKNTGMGTTAPFSLKHWVGWLSAAYYIDKK
ncbi:MAG: AmmeMemoRadiSam system protein B [Candidatus Kryptoniota bacterium]